MNSERNKQRIAKFDGSDFAFWRTQVEDYLYIQDLYRPLLGMEKGKKKEKRKKDWEVLDRKARGAVSVIAFTGGDTDKKTRNLQLKTARTMD